MTVAQNFIDNLKNLRVVMSVAFEFTQGHRNAFVEQANPDEVHQSERFITQIRALAAQLEKEFNTLEYLLHKSRTN
jgi:quinol monooxygenase YgiN